MPKLTNEVETRKWTDKVDFQFNSLQEVSLTPDGHLARAEAREKPACIKVMTSATRYCAEQWAQTKYSMLSSIANRLICLGHLVEFLLIYSLRVASIYINWFANNVESVQFFKDLNVTAGQKKFFKKALNSYYDAVAELLQSEHAVTPFLC